jgi:hypothetical protein
MYRFPGLEKGFRETLCVRGRARDEPLLSPIHINGEDPDPLASNYGSFMPDTPHRKQ